MREKGRGKYFLVVFLCSCIFIYGFIKVNINKAKDVKKVSAFTIDLKLKPFNFRIETKGYVFYINGNIFDNIKEECNDVYNGIFSK
jgi:hypothetical protein